MCLKCACGCRYRNVCDSLLNSVSWFAVTMIVNVEFETIAAFTNIRYVVLANVALSVLVVSSVVVLPCMGTSLLASVFRVTCRLWSLSSP